MQPEVAEWEEALKLAVTQEEEEQIAAAKAGIAYEEEKRTKWFHYYLSNADYDKAAELVVFPTEKRSCSRRRRASPRGHARAAIAGPGRRAQGARCRLRAGGARL